MFPLFLFIHLALRSFAYLHEYQQNISVSRLPNASNAVTFGLGLQITVDYIFYGEYRFIEWFKKPIDKLDKTSMLTKAEKYMK